MSKALVLEKNQDLKTSSLTDSSTGVFKKTLFVDLVTVFVFTSILITCIVAMFVLLQGRVNAQETDSLEKTSGVQSATRTESDYLQVCVLTSLDSKGTKTPNKLVDKEKCGTSDAYSDYFYALYPDVPTFIGNPGDTPLPGFFNIESKNVIQANLGESYQSKDTRAPGYKERNIVDDENVLYYEVKVNDDSIRIANNGLGKSIYIPLYAKDRQLIPPVGDGINTAFTKGLIPEDIASPDVNLRHVSRHSTLAPEYGVEEAVNPRSTLVPPEKDADDASVVGNNDALSPEKPEPITLADFKWLFISTGFGVGLVASLTALYALSGTIGGTTRRRREIRKKHLDHQLQEEEINMREWEESMQIIGDTMADYAQKDSDIANKTLFYPMINDVSHPLHVAFLDKLKKAQDVQKMRYHATNLEYVKSFASSFRESWGDLYSTAVEVGIPWMKKQEDQDRARKFLNLVMDEGASDGERENARDMLIKFINELFDESGETLLQDAICERYEVRPQILRNSINDSLDKNVYEIANQGKVAIERKV